MLNTLAGIIASSGGAPAVLSDYQSIATVTVGAGGASSISFTSIPSTYQHLQIRMSSRGTASTSYQIDLTFNNDTSSNYSPSHYLEGGGSTAVAGNANSTNASKISVYTQPRSDTTASVFGAAIMDILDYANTNKYKTLKHLGGFDANGVGYIDFDSGLWMSTSAINRIDVTPVAGIAQYSSFALYGIKG